MAISKQSAYEKITSLETRLSELGELDVYNSFVSESSDKAEAALRFLNNFYFRMPGGWYTNDMKEYFDDQVKLFSEVKEAMLKSGLGEDECASLERMASAEQKDYVWSENRYHIVPIMLEAYIKLRENYSRQALIR